MTKWAIATIYGDIERGFNPDPSKIWTVKDKDGNTTWDKIQNLSKEGWELVSVTPINKRIGDGSLTSLLLYTFKRPIED